ncbi:MAG TPA: hypothetical protein VF796_22675 [Humisphaera sp.]
MPRRLFTLLSAISLTLCIASTGAWIRTTAFGLFDDFEYTYPSATGSVWLAHGRVYVCRMTAAAPWWPPRPQPWSYHASTWEYAEPEGGVTFDALGFGSSRTEGNSGGSAYVQTWTVVPLWAVTAATAVLPAAWLAGQVRRWRLDRRARAGFCFACGYDLRASPARCPECGAGPKGVDA